MTPKENDISIIIFNFGRLIKSVAVKYSAIISTKLIYYNDPAAKASSIPFANCLSLEGGCDEVPIPPIIPIGQAKVNITINDMILELPIDCFA